MNDNLREQFRSIINRENPKDKKRLITKLFDSLPDKSSAGLEKIVMEFLKFVQEEDHQIYEHFLEEIQEELEPDNGEFGMGGDWWKDA